MQCIIDLIATRSPLLHCVLLPCRPLRLRGLGVDHLNLPAATTTATAAASTASEPTTSTASTHWMGRCAEHHQPAKWHYYILQEYIWWRHI